MTDLRSQLMAIREQAGQLTPRVVVDYARPTESPLHDRFEWDDSVAGERWREEQARTLIRSVKVSYGDTPQDVRAFVSVTRAAPPTREYVPAEVVADDPMLRAIVLRDMEREWRQLRAKYEHMAEFFDLVRADTLAA